MTTPSDKNHPAAHQATPPAREPDKKMPDLAPPGSAGYVAGQPIDKEEQAKTEAEHDAKMKAGEESRKKAEAAHLEQRAPPPDQHSKK